MVEVPQEDIIIENPYSIEAFKEVRDGEEIMQLRETIKVGFFELTKKKIETANQKHWRDYFLTGEVGTEAPEYIKKASKVIELVNLSEEEKRMATLLERAEARRDAESSDYYNNGIEAGMIQGMARGMAQGIAKRDLEIASTMLSDGLALEIVSKYTGLSPEYLRTLSE